MDGEFELVLCAETIEHVRDVQLFLSEVRRVLRPGGGLALTTPAHALVRAAAARNGFEAGFDPLSPHLRFFTRRSLRELLDAMGFDVELGAAARRDAARARDAVGSGCCRRRPAASCWATRIPRERVGQALADDYIPRRSRRPAAA